MNPIAKHSLQIASCVIAVFAITAFIYAVPFRDRALSVALNLFLIVTLAVSIRWGTRYALLLSVLSALGFSWALPPARHFHLSDGRVWTLLTACLVTGLVAGQLSALARKEASNAQQHRGNEEHARRAYTQVAIG
jgi:K+-sensing histidine kinase KdpD